MVIATNIKQSSERPINNVVMPVSEAMAINGVKNV
jgi:hypothetical protein